MVRHLRLCILVSLFYSLAGCGGGSSPGSGGGSKGSGAHTETSAHPPIVAQYRRTDLQYDPNALQFFPPHVTAYDSVYKRFFISNTTLNRIDVFDATQESQIGSIFVPEPWGMDVSPDGSKLYVATTFGDVYLIDPGAMQVVHRYPSATIGSQGFIATQAFILSDGQLALLGSIGGFYFDGSPNFAIWNPSTNAFTLVNAQLPNFGYNIGQMTLTADRSKVLVGGSGAQYVELYDPFSGSAISANVTCGQVEEILPTPDGQRVVVVGLGGNVEVLDANTLSEIGSAPNLPGYSAVLSHDGSTLYTVDLEANVLAWDSTTFAQKGWVPSFDISDLQSAIIAGSIDESGLIFGPMGHGVGFVDGSTINSGTQGTQFNIGFLSPSTGPLSGGTALQTEILTPQPAPDITTGTVYIGNASPTNISLSATSFSAETPPAANSGAADFTVVLPDGSLRIMPEDFSYGPSIVEVSTNASTADGGAQGVVFGYGLAGSQVTVGGQTAAITQTLTAAYPTIPYPFLMQAILFTVPANTAGTAADVTVTANGSTATASKALQYIPAVQSFPLSGASILQGVYSPQHSVLYLTDASQIDVFSPAADQWVSPITIPYANASSRLYGIALSPDGNTLAVSDAGNGKIYILNPTSPGNIASFDVSEKAAGFEPGGLAVTNTGIVYYATFIAPGGSAGRSAFHKLDTSSGTITDFINVEDLGDDEYIRVLLSPDGSQVYVNEGGHAWILATSDDSLSAALQVTVDEGSFEMAVSEDGSTLTTANFVTDENLNALSEIGYVDRDTWLPLAVYGQKLNSNGTLLFQPFTNGVDMIDGTTGLLDYRVALPIQIANVYDSLVVDNTDSLLFAITANGIARLDLSSLIASTAQARRFARATLSKRQRELQTRKIVLRDWFHRPLLRHVAPSTRFFGH